MVVAPALCMAVCSATSTGGAVPGQRHPRYGAPPPTIPCTNTNVVETWSLQERAEQLVVVSVQETDVQSALPFVQQGVGGVLLYGSSAPPDLGSQLETLESSAPAGIRPLVITDEEGGGVQRMANLAGSLPWPRTMASTLNPTQVRELAEQAATRMRANGVTVDLAPVLDVTSGPGPDDTHPDGPRSFSVVPQTASAYGVAFLQGLEAGGVIPVVKDFPGEGSATSNPDDAPAATPPIGTLETTDLVPFQAAISAGVPAVMVGDVSVPGLTSQPAALSSAVIQGLLRTQLNFGGLVLTDALSAGAIGAQGLDVPTAAVEAVEAGADMVLFNSTDTSATTQAVVSQIVDAVTTGALPSVQFDAAVLKVLTAKGINLCVG